MKPWHRQLSHWNVFNPAFLAVVAVCKLFLSWRHTDGFAPVPRYGHPYSGTGHFDRGTGARHGWWASVPRYGHRNQSGIPCDQRFARFLPHPWFFVERAKAHKRERKINRNEKKKILIALLLLFGEDKKAWSLVIVKAIYTEEWKVLCDVLSAADGASCCRNKWPASFTAIVENGTCFTSSDSKQWSLITSLWLETVSEPIHYTGIPWLLQARTFLQTRHGRGYLGRGASAFQEAYLIRMFGRSGRRQWWLCRVFWQGGVDWLQEKELRIVC